jgi:hypothetical protein
VASSVPDGLQPGRDRDLDGRLWHIWMRRALFVFPIGIVVLALLNGFGQRPDTLHASSPAASLDLRVPSRVRGGLIYQARFTIDAREPLDDARIVLESGWLEGMTLNEIEPAPREETSADGRLVLALGAIPAGRSFQLYMQFQVNPTSVGRRDADADLLDGSTRLLHVDRTITVFP